jgi:hypothetical protein
MLTDLTKIALVYLGIPSSEADSERSFSALNRILNAKRDSLLSKTACQLSFLHQNSKQIESNNLFDSELDDSLDSDSVSIAVEDPANEEFFCHSAPEACM